MTQFILQTNEERVKSKISGVIAESSLNITITGFMSDNDPMKKFDDIAPFNNEKLCFVYYKVNGGQEKQLRLDHLLEEGFPPLDDQIRSPLRKQRRTSHASNENTREKLKT